MPAHGPRYSMEEFARRSEAIFQRRILPLLTDADHGKFVAIDIETEDYELDADEYTAAKRLQARLPRSQMCTLRIGSPWVHRLGLRDIQGGSS